MMRYDAMLQSPEVEFEMAGLSDSETDQESPEEESAVPRLGRRRASWVCQGYAGVDAVSEVHHVCSLCRSTAGHCKGYTGIKHVYGLVTKYAYV